MSGAKKNVSVVGSGITERVQWREELQAVGEEARLEEFFESINAAFSRPWGRHAEIIRGVREMEVSARAEAPSRTADEGRLWADYWRERVTFAWYISTAVEKADDVERFLATGESWAAIDAAVDLGELLTELQMKQLWEGHALYGQRTADERARGAREVRKMSLEERVSAVTAALVSGKLSVTGACKHAAAKRPGTGSWKAYERDWYAHKKAPQPSE